MKSKSLAPKPGHVDNTVTLRDGYGYGGLPDELRWNFQTLTLSIMELHNVKNTNSRNGPNGLDRWVGDSIPTFRFSSICPITHSVDPTIHENMVVEIDHLEILGRDHFKFLKRVQDRNNCTILLRLKDSDLQTRNEIGLVGKKDDIRKCVIQIQGYCVSHSPTLKT